MKLMKIKEFAEVISGSTPKTNIDEYWNGEYLWITPAEINDTTKYIYNSERKITEAGVKSCSLRLLKKNTVILTSRAPIGKVAIAGNDLYCNQGFKNLVCNEEIAKPKYIYYWLISKQEYLRSLGRGATFKEISKKIVEEIEVPIQEINKQNKIVEVLDKAQELIDKRKEQIELLDELVKSRFVEMFGEYFNDEYITNLMSVSDKITDGEHGTVPRVDEGIPYLMARNINQNNQLDFKEVSYIEEKVHEKIYSRCNPEYEDLLIVCVGATIGKVTLVPKMEQFSLARSVALVKYNRENINGKYLLWLFNHNYMKVQLKNSSNESAQAGLYIGKIKDLKIPIPPIELQNQFADFVKQIDKLKFEMENSLKELEDNFNSLMQKAFKGELFS